MPERRSEDERSRTEAVLGAPGPTEQAAPAATIRAVDYPAAPTISIAERGDHIEQGGGAVDAPQHESTDAEHKGRDPYRPQQPAGRGGRNGLGGGTAHAGAAAIASRGTGRSRIRQWIAAAKRPSAIEIHHIRS